jgi:ribonuclease P protein component
MDSARATPAEAPSRAAVERLRKRADFLAAARGRRFHTDRMTVQGLAREAADSDSPPRGLRVGLTVTKRVGHATERNRIKRRLRRAVAEALAARDASPPCDIVVVARRSCLDTAYSQLVEDLSKAVAAVTAPRSGRRGSFGPPPRGTPHA